MGGTVERVIHPRVLIALDTGQVSLEGVMKALKFILGQKILILPLALPHV